MKSALGVLTAGSFMGASIMNLLGYPSGFLVTGVFFLCWVWP